MIQEIDEHRANLDQIERARRAAETELVESRDRANLLHQQNNSLINQKHKYEKELQSIQDEVEEASNEAKNAREKAVKAVQDATFMSEDLRKEQVRKYD
jgi:chromosome segregation ATPase